MYLAEFSADAEQDSERTKVVQSISSVIQALPPEQEIQPIEVSNPCPLSLYLDRNVWGKAILNPVIAKLSTALNSTASQVRPFWGGFRAVQFVVTRNSAPG